MLQIGSFRFLLQLFFVEAHAGNFMMSLNVEDVDAWWEYIERQEMAKKYPGIMCRPPQMQPWGIRVLYLSDPTGVLYLQSSGVRGCSETSTRSRGLFRGFKIHTKIFSSHNQALIA